MWKKRVETKLPKLLDDITSIVDGEVLGSIFVGRQNTGRIAKIITDAIDVKEDYVTTRVLWLEGLEPGKNKGGNVDSHSRYIYIHGTPEEGLIGKPASHRAVQYKLSTSKLESCAHEITIMTADDTNKLLKSCARS